MNYIPYIRKHLISFSQKLFIAVICLFITFALCFIAYQYQREKSYKIELLHTRLQDYNRLLHEFLDTCTDLPKAVQEYFMLHNMKDMRVTLIDANGVVLYDNYQDAALMVNHITRSEIRQAIANGQGFDVRRTSETTGVTYFYSATRYETYFIRSALPYSVNLVNYLKTDKRYLWFTATVALLLIVVIYTFTNRLGHSINQLREFAKQADRNEPIDVDTLTDFPHNELDEISQHIMQIYKRLHQTKEALYIEREKLITHLRISREGLGVFNRDKKEILVNNLFTQYSNLISDTNIETTEDIFNINEFGHITHFIDKRHKNPRQDERRTSITIHKNGRTFIVECIIFQDASFEISINDVTQQEEQARLKQQLTQNIAHELKTPVSSIQGYLETIVSNNLTSEKLKLFIERCYAQSNRLSHLLSDISLLTRMEEASQMIKQEWVNIHTLVTNIIGEVALELEEKHITVMNSLKKNILVKGDQSLLYSVFRNLMDNAVAYAGTGILIHIKCFREENNLYYFSFSDTGVGVPPEHLNRLFERFYRVDTGRSRKLGGTGLGLAIVKRAVLLHGGSISAKNNTGGGLEFIFTLAKNAEMETE